MKANSPWPARSRMLRPVRRDGERSWVVKLRDVAWFEAAGNNVQVHFGAERPLLLRSLDQLERRLDPSAFFRANRSMVVNLEHIERLDTGVRGELIAHLKGGATMAFSRRQSVTFRRRSSL